MMSADAHGWTRAARRARYDAKTECLGEERNAAWRRSLPPADAARLQRLLAASSEACGSSPWTLAELCQLALVDGHQALADVLGVNRSMKAGGRFLGRLTGVVVDDLVLELVTRERAGRVYAVVAA